MKISCCNNYVAIIIWSVSMMTKLILEWNQIYICDFKLWPRSSHQVYKTHILDMAWVFAKWANENYRTGGVPLSMLPTIYTAIPVFCTFVQPRFDNTRNLWLSWYNKHEKQKTVWQILCLNKKYAVVKNSMLIPFLSCTNPISQQLYVIWTEIQGRHDIAQQTYHSW